MGLCNSEARHHWANSLQTHVRMHPATPFTDEILTTILQYLFTHLGDIWHVNKHGRP